MAYYQLYATDNKMRPVGAHYVGQAEAHHLVAPPYALDRWRTALFIAYLSEHPQLRVIGVDGQVGLLLEDALDALVASGWIDSDLRDSIPLAYEVTDVGQGWYHFHHHRMHLAMLPVQYSFDTLVDCLAGPGVAPTEDCLRWFDTDEDGDVDLVDFAGHHLH